MQPTSNVDTHRSELHILARGEFDDCAASRCSFPGVCKGIILLMLVSRQKEMDRESSESSPSAVYLSIQVAVDGNEAE